MRENPYSLCTRLLLTFAGVFFYLQHTDPATAKKLEFLPLVSLSVFIFFFSVGFGPIPWLMTAELMSPEVKERATAISSEYLLLM